MPNAIIKPITPDILNIYWAEAWAQLKRAMEKGRIDLKELDVKEDVATGKKQLWLIEGQAFVLTEMTENDITQDKTLWVYALAGEGIRKWEGEAITYMEIFAREQNCQRLVAYGRPGFSRAAKTYGYTPISIKFEKRL